jgi:hypothetical protein
MSNKKGQKEKQQSTKTLPQARKRRGHIFFE